MTINREIVTDYLARAFVGALLALLSATLLGDFLKTGRVTGLFLLVSEAMVIVLMIARRRAHFVDRSVGAAIATTATVTGPALVRTADAAGLVPDGITAALSVAGLALVIAGKLTLGRSFGIAPANRGIIARGPYLIVRHPIYAGYLMTHAGFLIAHVRPWNVVILAAADTALIVRALIEERVLSADIEYQSYCRRVTWHLVPGVF